MDYQNTHFNEVMLKSLFPFKCFQYSRQFPPWPTHMCTHKKANINLSPSREQWVSKRNNFRRAKRL